VVTVLTDRSAVRRNAFAARVSTELGPDLVARADVAVTDSLAQTAAYDPPFKLLG
jgi:hypothetical protein